MVVYVGVCYTCEAVKVYASIEASRKFHNSHPAVEHHAVVSAEHVANDSGKRTKPGKPPWRGVKRVVGKGRGMQASRVELECGHTVFSQSLKKARCIECFRKGVSE